MEPKLLPQHTQTATEGFKRSGIFFLLAEGIEMPDPQVAIDHLNRSTQADKKEV